MPHAHRPRRSCLYVPGANSRALEKAKSLAADTLMYDLRNHGESDKSKLGVGTGGFGERFDLLAAAEFIASEKPGAQIGLLRFCYGANTSLFAFQEDSDAIRRCNVKAMVAVNPLTNSDALKSLKFPPAVFREAEKHFENRTGGISFDAP